ncbi:MAG: helix-hairpin-helix domain-containing protein [Ferruginibacter sp.]
MSTKLFYSILYFTRKEKRGALFLLILIAMLCSIPFLIAIWYRNEASNHKNYDSKIAQLSKQSAAQKNKTYSFEQREYDKRKYPPYQKPAYTPKTKGVLFEFDPNTLEEEGWKKLGLRDKTISTILNFRNKGGRFRKSDDIGKIWGLFPDEAERLKPFVRIATTNQPDFKNTYKPYKAYEKPAIAIVDINAADTISLMALPGIGAKLSARILQFRNKLGGFHSIEQVKETYALHDSIFQKIMPYLSLNTALTPININEANIDQLKAHPYIRYYLANAIVQYRLQHGAYQSVEDIKKIMIIDKESFVKMAPYLTVY